MKKFLAAAGLMIAMAGTAMAANPSAITLHVTPTGTKDITLNTSTNAITVALSFAVGSVNNVTPTPVAVLNSGNIAETYQLDVTSSGAWNLAGAAAPDTYHLQAIFNSTAPTMPFGSAGNFDLTGVLKSSSVSVFAGDQSGLNVIPGAGGAKNLWFGIDMPTLLTTPATSAAQDIVVQINAL